MKIEFTNNQVIITRDDGSIYMRQLHHLTTWDRILWEFIASLDDATDPINAKIEAVMDAIAVKPSTSEEMVTALDNGGVVKVESDLAMTAISNVTKSTVLELGPDTVITSNQSRLFNIENGSLTIEGGEIDVANGFVALVKTNGTLNISNCTLKDSSDNGLLYTNGIMTGTTMNLSDCELVGENYFPGSGTYNFTNCTFENTFNTAYLKNGITTFKNCHFKTTESKGNWAHWNNGSIVTSNCLVVEACNYGDHGEPIMNVIDCTFEPVADPEDANYKSYGLLVINYDGHTVDMGNTNVPYRVAEVSGHVTTGANVEPSDGWYYFNDDNTTLVNG